MLKYFEVQGEGMRQNADQYCQFNVEKVWEAANSVTGGPHDFRAEMETQIHMISPCFTCTTFVMTSTPHLSRTNDSKIHMEHLKSFLWGEISTAELEVHV